jgi:hypothetical protein
MSVPENWRFPMGDVIQLESAEEEYYSFSLSTWISATIESQDEVSKQAICTLWEDEAWDEIVEKFGVEGSTWYVWWMDGVRTYMVIDKRTASSGPDH